MRALVLLLLLGLSGCRYHVTRNVDGAPRTAGQLARLVPGETSLTEALAALGAPDGVEWALDEDALVYDHWEVRTTHWELENPLTIVTGLGPQTLIGEAVVYVMFVSQTTGRALRMPRPQQPVPGRPGFTSKPLTLDGDERGRERVRLVFTRRTRLLARIEVARGRPAGGVGGLARGTFLR